MKYLNTIVLAVCIISCSTNEDIYNEEVFIEDTISFDIDSDEFYKSHQTHVIEKNDTTYLLREVYFDTGIDIYNWDSQKRVNRVRFQDEGPQAISKFGGSAFLPLSNEYNSFFIADLNGKTYLTENDSILYSEQYMGGENLRFYGMNPFKPVRIKDKVFIDLASDYLQGTEEFESRPLVASFDLNTKEVVTTNIDYPKEVKGVCWSEQHRNISMIANNDELIISYSTTPEIQIYNSTGNKLISTNTKAKSIFFDEVEPYSDCDFENFDRYFSYLKSVPRYYALIYDKFNNVYYRIVILPEDNGQPDGKRNQDIVMPFSIMVLDKNFVPIAETKFPAGIHDYTDYFLDKDGLWISKNNEGYKDFDENKMRFDLFSFKTKD